MATKQTNRAATEALLNFIRKSPTAFHAVEQIGEKLTQEGFERLEECANWELVPGGRYFVTRNQSSVIAFRIPQNKPTCMVMTATHTDSPMFKLKQECESTAFDTYLRLNTEVYCGTILSTWWGI